MKRKRLCNIILALLLSVATFAEDSIAAAAHEKPKKEIYNGTQIKLDILSPVLISGLNNWKMQHYEMAINVRLAQRFYPTFELGYTGGRTSRGDTITYNGQGGFFRVGADICPLKKHPESPHAMLVGIRIGTAVQGNKQGLVTDSWHPYTTRADCWGEIVAGCQVEIAKVNQTAFYMGWMGRVKFLFTCDTEDKDGNATPIYIPGYGNRDNIGWGVNYYIGWKL